MRLRGLVCGSLMLAAGAIACSAAVPEGFPGATGPGPGAGNGSDDGGSAGVGGDSGSSGADGSPGLPGPGTPDSGSAGAVDTGTGPADSAPAPPPDANPPNDGFDQFQHHNLDVVNQYRATLGVAPLVLDKQLCTFALAGSQELTQDHTPHQHFINAGNDGSLWTSGFTSTAAENQGDPNGWTQLASDPTQNELLGIDSIQKAMFDEGPGAGEAHGHYTNMMDSGSHRLGVGLIEVNGQLYLTNDFSQ